MEPMLGLVPHFPVVFLTPAAMSSLAVIVLLATAAAPFVPSVLLPLGPVTLPVR
jgi:hypothetical protein